MSSSTIDAGENLLARKLQPRRFGVNFFKIKLEFNSLKCEYLKSQYPTNIEDIMRDLFSSRFEWPHSSYPERKGGGTRV
jgi:hypothetical protein